MFKFVTVPIQPNVLLGIIFDDPLALVTLFIPFTDPRAKCNEDANANSIIAAIVATV
ncbi:hypothetical protein [Nitrososphaera sp. AFS]|jgi:hypothetical protein|uniref:hypothetical protein n=1 Tax=Nitrososphaera sp. AFS TaxID=2301191 RepID=UPI001392241A|nr:hypothetical protein [Nitrososphaera sp. AFS]